MNTILLTDKAEDITTAADILRRSGLVAFPTETVYGLGGDALDPQASRKIYAAKGRPSDNPLIVHIADISDVYKLAANVPRQARDLMEAYWPGPLTIILRKLDIVPDETTGGLGTVAIRMPAHPAALELIRRSNIYIAAPSANTSGKPSPTTAQHVSDDLSGKIDAIIDGGPVGIGIESTIIDMTSEQPTILRPGFITRAQLENIVGPVAVDPAIIHPDPKLRPKAPGMKYTHYAPNGYLTLVESHTGDISAVSAEINRLCHTQESLGYRAVVLAPIEHADSYSSQVITVGSLSDGKTVSARLYAALRECDKLEADYIYSESFADFEIGGAIMNRLLRAAGHHVLNID